jgi:hypothetical protein
MWLPGGAPLGAELSESLRIQLGNGGPENPWTVGDSLFGSKVAPSRGGGAVSVGPAGAPALGPAAALEQQNKEAMAAVLLKVGGFKGPFHKCPDVPPRFFPDNYGRPAMVIAVVGPDTKPGTPEDFDWRKRPAWFDNLPADVKNWDMAHLLATGLGGPGGSHWENMIPMPHRSNEDMKSAEREVWRRAKRNKQCLVFTAVAVYAGINLYPNAIYIGAYPIPGTGSTESFELTRVQSYPLP